MRNTESVRKRLAPSGVQRTNEYFSTTEVTETSTGQLGVIFHKSNHLEVVARVRKRKWSSGARTTASFKALPPEGTDFKKKKKIEGINK